jgi:hypothetical protein
VNREALCLALARHREAIPLEVARAIIEEVCPVPAAATPIDVYALDPVAHGPYTIAAERLAAVLPEVHPLHQLHWRETEKYRHGIPMAPDYQAMIARDAAGHCLQLTIRLEGQLVGHLRMWLWPRSLHTSRPIAEEDALFIHPEHRGGFLVMALLRTAERWLLQACPELSEIKTNSKLVARREGGPDASVLMRRLGYQAVGLMHSKTFIQGESHVQ